MNVAAAKPGILKKLRLRFEDQGVEDGILAHIPLPTRGRLYASPMPYGPYDPFNRLMKLYRKRDIRLAVMLVTDEEIKKKAKRDLVGAYGHNGIEVERCPIADLTSPSLKALTTLVPKLADVLKTRNVAIHCNAGVGRTGVVVACVVKHMMQMDGEAAIDYIKAHMHIKLTSEQMRIIARWAPDPESAVLRRD